MFTKTKILLISLLFVSCSTLAPKDGPTPRTPSSSEDQKLVTMRGQVFVEKNPGHGASAAIRGDVIKVSPGLSLEDAKRNSEYGISAYVKENSPVALQNCSDATITLVAGEGNFIPNRNGSHVYRSPEIVAFTCNDKAGR